MERNATPDYLVVDWEDPENPRLVIARALRAAPIVTDQPGDKPGDALLAVLDWDQWDWVRDILGEDVGVQLTRPGVAARLRRWVELPAPAPVPAATGHGGRSGTGNGHDGGGNGDAAADAADDDGDDWFEGWTDDRVEHYTGEFPEAPDIEPFDGWTSPYDDEDEITARTWQRD